jgi:transcriptional regulator with XRE-family HTH domain
MKKAIPVKIKRKAPFKKKEGPTVVDVHVGERLKQRRSILGMSQQTLAQVTGVSFQQIQKYEKGINRVSASRLHAICKALSVPSAYFFTDAPEPRSKKGLSEDSQATFQSSEMMNSRETLKLLRVYYSVDDEKARQRLYRIIRQMVDNMGDE